MKQASGKRATTFGRQGDSIRRRELVLLLGSAMMTARILRAQQKAMPVIGLLSSGPPGANAAKVAAFCQGLREIGYVEGQNLAIEYRWAEGHYNRLPALAAELVGRKVDVIVAMAGTPSALAATNETSTIPIVFLVLPGRASGLVASVARPDGNVTGVGMFSIELFSVPCANLSAGVSARFPLRDLDNRNRQLGVLRLTDATIAQSFSKN